MGRDVGSDGQRHPAAGKGAEEEEAADEEHGQDGPKGHESSGRTGGVEGRGEGVAVEVGPLAETDDAQAQEGRLDGPVHGRMRRTRFKGLP